MLLTIFRLNAFGLGIGWNRFGDIKFFRHWYRVQAPEKGPEIERDEIN